MALNIYTGNRMENLVEALASVVAKPLASPFVPETIVVQSKGMQRWLAMELAKRFGIWANGEYPFPEQAGLAALLQDTPEYSRHLVFLSAGPELENYGAATGIPGTGGVCRPEALPRGGQ